MWKGMGVEEAEKMFRNRGLVCIVSDSSYVKTLPAGCILEYNPAAGQKVKEGRTIYLTINTIEVPLHIVPMWRTTVRCGRRKRVFWLRASSWPRYSIFRVRRTGCMAVKYKGRQLSIGEKVPTGAVLTLMVGDGGALKADSLGVDSVGGTVEPVLSEDSADR